MSVNSRVFLLTSLRALWSIPATWPHPTLEVVHLLSFFHILHLAYMQTIEGEQSFPMYQGWKRLEGTFVSFNLQEKMLSHLQKTLHNLHSSMSLDTSWRLHLHFKWVILFPIMCVYTQYVLQALWLSSALQWKVHPWRIKQKLCA